MSSLDAASAVVTRIGAAGFLVTEIAGAARALGLGVDAHADQRRFIGVDQIGKSADLHDVGARAGTGKVLDQALVDAHHGDVDAHLGFDLFNSKTRKWFQNCPETALKLL